MPISRRIAALLVTVAWALPTAASAQTPVQTQPLPSQGSGSSRPPVALGGGGGNGRSAGRSRSSSSGPRRTLPNTGSDPRLLFLAGAALTLLGAGLRLRTADADDY